MATEERSKAALKSKFTLIQGGKVGVIRNPKALTQTKEVVSPVDSNVIFVIKKATNREDVARSNLFAKMRFVSEEDGGRVATEREIPMGDLQVQTVMLCLVSWNIETDGGKVVPVGENTILDYLDPEERVFLYEQILEFNPLWGGNREEVKKD